jgi:hypothetical protein
MQILICVILQSAKICGSDIICQWMEERLWRIVDLSRRGDCILEAPKLDLETLAVLTAGYEAIRIPFG